MLWLLLLLLLNVLGGRTMGPRVNMSVAIRLAPRLTSSKVSWWTLLRSSRWAHVALSILLHIRRSGGLRRLSRRLIASGRRLSICGSMLLVLRSSVCCLLLLQMRRRRACRLDGMHTLTRHGTSIPISLTLCPSVRTILIMLLRRVNRGLLSMITRLAMCLR